MQHVFNNISIDQLPSVASNICALLNGQTLWCFYGEMGAGKTTLIKAIGLSLGIDETISSPTFSLVNEYKTKNEATIFHFDFYRINTLEEVYDIGYEDYFYSGNICLLEWPQKIEPLLANEKTASITLVKISENIRDIIVDFEP